MVSPLKAAGVSFQIPAAQAGKAGRHQSGNPAKTSFESLFAQAGSAEGEGKGDRLSELKEALIALEELPTEKLESEEELAGALIQLMSFLTKLSEDELPSKELQQKQLRQLIDQLQALAANTKTPLGDAEELEQAFKQLTAMIQEGATELQQQTSSSESQRYNQASEAFRQLPGTPMEANHNQMLPASSVDSAKAEQLPGRPEPAAPTPTVRMANLTEELGEVLRGSFRLNGMSEGTQQIRVNITPENLGHLDIRLTVVNGKMAAQIFTSNLAAKEVIELQLNQLRASLLQQGVTIDKIEITQHNPQQSFGQQHTSPEQRFAQQQKQGNASHKNGYQQFEEEAAAAGSPDRSETGMLKVDYTI